MLSRKPWRGDYVLMFIGIMLFSIFASQMLIAMLHQARVTGFRSENGFGVMLLATLGIQGMAIMLIPIFLCLHQTSFREAFGLSQSGWWKHLLFAAGLLLLILPVILVVSSQCVNILIKLGHPPENEKAVDMFMNATTPLARGYFIFFVIVAAPIAEEFIFRGVLYPAIKQAGWPRLAFFGVNALFALFHMSLSDFIPLFLLAMFLTWIYEHTDCLLASITAHSLFNTINVVLLYLSPQIQDFLQRHHVPLSQ